MKPENPLTTERKRAIDCWLSANYEELTKHTDKKLKSNGFQGRDGAEFMSKLYDTLLQHAFYSDGWETDIEILKQSKVRLTGYVLNLHRYYAKHDSTEDIQEAHNSAGAELPDSFIVEPEHDKKLHLEQVAQARDAVCQTPYDYDLVLVLQGDETCVAIGQKYGVHHSTVSRHKDQIAQKLREQMLNRGLV